MALHLHFGNRLDLLADVLARDLGHAWTDPLDPPEIVVPSPSVGKWLKLHLAARGRTLLNLPTTTLESFLWDGLEPDPGDRMLRVDALQHAVAACLSSALLSEPEFGSVLRFVTGSDGAVDPTLRVQLARETARLFMEYEYNRPSVHAQGRWVVEGIDRSWPDRAYFSALGAREEGAVERWQRRLHGKVFGPEGPLAGTGYLGLPRLHRLRREQGRIASGKDVHLISVDKISHFHRNLLLEMSDHREVHLYLVNPCMEFWEDLDTFRRRRERSKGRTGIRALTGAEFKGGSIPSDLWTPEADPALLRLWGSTARENVVLWCQAVDHDFEDRSKDPLEDDSTLLRVLQHCLLHRHPGPLLEPLDRDGELVATPDDDGSIRILAAPEKLREIEAVRDAVLQWLSEDPERKPSDAVVYLPDPESRIAQIEAVFQAHPPGHPGWLPISVLGVRGGGSLWARGAKALLELARVGMDRTSLLDFADNPLVRARRDSSESDVRVWARWMAGTGILRGWDASEREKSGESPKSAVDAHTVRAGVLRLATATLTDGPVDLGLDCGWGDSLLSPWRDKDASDSDQVERFAAFVEDLERDLDDFRKRAGGTLVESGSAFAELCDRWLEPKDDPVEIGIRQTVMAGLEPLFLRGKEQGSLAELAETLRTSLEAEAPGSARAWGGALTFAPLRPSHILPHRLVVVAGLDGDVFPGEPVSGSLDLLSRGRILGDPDPVADNRHAFLLALLSARDRVVLSWCARDLQKDEIRPPSSVLLELEAALQEGFLGGSKSDTALRRSVPLLARTGGVLLGDPPAWDVPSWDPSPDAGMDPERRPVLPSGPSRISTWSLQRFLENPLFHRVKTEFAADPDRDDLHLDVESVLESEPLEMAVRCRELLGQFLMQRDLDPEVAVRGMLSVRAWESRSPEGEFLEMEARALTEWFRTVVQGLDGVLPATGTGLSQRDLGSLFPDGICMVGVADGLEIRLEGPLPLAWLAVPPEVSLTLVDLAPIPGKKVESSRKARLYLAGAALRSAGFQGGIRLVWVERMKEAKVIVEKLPLAADAVWISDLVQDCLDPACAQFLPLRECLANGDSPEAVQEALDDSRRRRDLLEDLLEPHLPQMESQAFSALLLRRFRPWLEAQDG